jgi:drug/metabolite transporter (DMT)-like permease
VATVRRPSKVELMLGVTIVIWAFNFTVTRFELTNGFQPLSYSVIRYGGGALGLLAIARWRGEALPVDRADVPLLVFAGLLGVVGNQLAYVYAIKMTNASTVALMLGAVPVLAVLIAAATRVETLSRRFVAAATVSFAGVVLVALGEGGLAANLLGDALGLVTALTWAAYAVAITPLMDRYSPFRVSALVISIGWLMLVPFGVPQLLHQSYHLRPLVWVGLAFAILGPLVLTNLLWFAAIQEVGPSRASLFANAQPFVAVLFALLLLSEPLHPLEVAGAVLIGMGIVLGQRRRRLAVPPAGE